MMCKGCLAKMRTDAHAKLAVKVEVALEDLSVAEKAVKAGKKDVALAQLAKVRGVLEGLRDRVKPKAADNKTVNSVCPMMGGKFNPNKVDAKLVREYKGQKVGFCCGGCPQKWDKLSNTQKDRKLAAAIKKK